MARKSDPHARPVRVFAAKSLTEANLAVAFLDEAGIPARVEDAHMAEALGDAAKAFAKGGGIRVVVASDRAAEAEKALEGFRRHGPRGGEEE